MEPYLGEIRMFAGNFAPRGWALCAGQILPIAQYTALFSILGTTYGGDGRTTFGLPDLRGRTPIHVSPSYSLGSKGGTETSALTAAQLPAHTHAVTGTAMKCNTVAPGSSNDPTANYPTANTATHTTYATAAGANEFMAADAVVTGVAPVGGGQPINNMMPYTCINFIIALQGIFPSRA